jgi:formylglycine-generating enzyme required for sulfatase activity
VPDGTGWWPLPVAAFAIARFPVTVAQYGAFVAAGGYEEPSLWQVEGWDWRQAMGHQASPYAWREQQAHPNRPVVGVSWYEAMAFCRWLSLAMDEPIRLPTERQWQFAAGGEERRPFPWGKAAGNPDTRANTSGSGIGAPAPVGIYPAGASPEGVMDLAGNVCEWCCDSFEDPPRFELEDCDGQSHAELRVARGGGWWSSPAEASSNGREGFRPGLCDRDIGLRLVRHAVAG